MDAVRFVKALENVKRVNEEFNRTIDEFLRNNNNSSHCSELQHTGYAPVLQESNSL
ncbi:MAG: hypothetical protein JW904_10095 [Spirochaetales bacterium]|nr:hypothetical protein [Spirochaetales bacterium]